MLGAADVHRRSLLRIVLGPFDVRPRRGVQDELELPARELGRREPDIPLLARERERGRERLGERRPELPPGARDQDAAA
jgi:hypothetical protein